MGGYDEEIQLAKKFYLDNIGDNNLRTFFNNIKNSSLMHSEKWSLIFDYIKRNYPYVDGKVITGLVYLAEEGNTND